MHLVSLWGFSGASCLGRLGNSAKPAGRGPGARRGAKHWAPIYALAPGCRGNAWVSNSPRFCQPYLLRGQPKHIHTSSEQSPWHEWYESQRD